MLSDTLKINYNFIDKIEKLNLEVISETVTYTMLHLSNNISIPEIYKDMINFAKEKNMQIRGGFMEVYLQDNT